MPNSIKWLNSGEGLSTLGLSTRLEICCSKTLLRLLIYSLLFGSYTASHGESVVFLGIVFVWWINLYTGLFAEEISICCSLLSNPGLGCGGALPISFFLPLSLLPCQFLQTGLGIVGQSRSWLVSFIATHARLGPRFLLQCLEFPERLHEEN